MRITTPAAALLSVLFLAACGGSSGTDAGSAAAPSTAAPTPAATPKTVTFHESEFKIDPPTVSLAAGTYQFVYVNDGKFPHDLHVTGQGSTQEIAGATATLKAGEMGSFTITLKPGTYTFFCAVPGHKDRGMQGTLTVT